jgi:hypothetical protein
LRSTASIDFLMMMRALSGEFEAALECENAIKQHTSAETFRIFDVVAFGMKSDCIFFP